MKEKSLEILRDYNIKTGKTIRARGGMILYTDTGVKLLLECSHPDSFYARENVITGVISENGFCNIDTYMLNNQGNLISVDEEGHRYVLKNWWEGKDCNLKDIRDICETVKGLARLHIVMDNISDIINRKLEENNLSVGLKDSEDLYGQYIRHTKELKMAWNYLKTKKNRQDFEAKALAAMEGFYAEASEALKLLEKDSITERLELIKKIGQIRHGSYNYHNVSFVKGQICISNFERVKAECQIVDLYQFMRKVLEKYNWNMELAYKMIDEYHNVKNIEQGDLDMLSAMFAFPEKYWKLINRYLNTNKVWIPPRSVEKLDLVIEQNVKRKEFVQTLFA